MCTGGGRLLTRLGHRGFGKSAQQGQATGPLHEGSTGWRIAVSHG
ncbi:hypothetical protein ACS15_3847 [Ralstonia insidiosa]|uniref:Uncharacterized protein n=1 Tax=Ralstonia insidiosa TaxID=190721 RepID=A0AAC9BJ31_9RALS|nr:hypothetical protein ACS15_3847 [Ralstonia insidiosa]